MCKSIVESTFHYSFALIKNRIDIPAALLSTWRFLSFPRYSFLLDTLRQFSLLLNTLWQPSLFVYSRQGGHVQLSCLTFTSSRGQNIGNCRHARYRRIDEQRRLIWECCITTDKWKLGLVERKKILRLEYLSCLVELLDLMSFSVPVETVTKKHLIFSDSAFFRHDETSAVLMMTARVRGPSIVDEAALVRPLQFDKVTGFGLEMYDDEAKHFSRVSSDHPCTFCLPQVKTVTSWDASKPRWRPLLEESEVR